MSYRHNKCKRVKMSGQSPQRSKDSKSASSGGGIANAFFQAEEQFQKQPEEWKVQKGRKNRQNEPLRPREDLRNKLDYGRTQPQSACETGGRGDKRPAQTRDDRSAFNKRPPQNSDPHKEKYEQSSQRGEKRQFNKSSHKRNELQNEQEQPDHHGRSSVAATSTHNKQDRYQSSSFSFTRLQQISAKDSTDIIRTLANSQNGLDEFLKGTIKPDFMYLIVKILSKLTASDWEENKEHVLMRTSTPEFFKKITLFVTCLVTDEQSFKRKEEMEQFFDNLLTFFHAVMTKLPTVAADHLLAPLRATRMAMGGVTEFQNVTISENLQERIKQIMSDFEERKKEKEERETIMKEKKESVYPKPLGNIRDVPLFPRPEDIDCGQGMIVPNKIKGPYSNVEHYLDVQFRLLREDFIAPVRHGINEYRIGHEDKRSHARKKVNNIRIYRRVKFLKPKVILDKVGYDICFDPEKKLRVKWEHSKRFIYGSLLLFTSDNFHSFFLATVVNRDLAALEKDRKVSVILCDTNELAQDILAKEFIMAESEVYFEPYYNVLKALQRFDSDTFPMKKYFVYVETKTERPAYTRNGNDVYTISAGDKGINGRKTIKLFDLHTWPACSELGFDTSQMSAFKAALTNDLSVIQGPPGTGKTFLGLKIAAALLENSVIWNYDHKTPILVICYTNHALDQFLEGILENGLTNSIVRIGGRSKSELLEPFNLKEMRKSVSYYSPNRDQVVLLKDLKREMADIFENIKTLQDNLEHLDKSDGIISLKTLKLGMRNRHQDFFRNNDDLLEWLLFGMSQEVRSQQKLISTTDKGIERQRTKNDEEIEFDLSDFENIARLKEVLFDNIEFEESDRAQNSNSNIQIYFSCTLDEIHKKIDEYTRLIECLPNAEERREIIQQKMRQAKKAEHDLRLILTHFEEKLKKTGIPTEEETNGVCEIADLHSLNSAGRWILYKSWVEFLKAGYWMMIGKLEERYRRGARRYDEVRQFDDLRIVQQADVVGITTTTAARLQAMLRELKPKIGDHKQLRPSPAEYRLGVDYHLDVSLFERLVNNGINYHTLSTQHRMRPEISRLLVPTIYPSLTDHPSTLSRQRVRGMNNNLFFMTHQHFEESVDDIMSKKNLFEARMVMLLARHLLLQGYRPNEITVLTTYSGQMYLMKDEQKRLEISKDLQVTVVDNFQGEENQIILLSLVRSNADNKIGFLKTENRVCVALSRARDGLFVFGNMDCLVATSPLWQRIKQSFVDQDAFGPALVLRCETHRNQLTRIVTHNDFNPVMEGGCSKPCDETLPCGHHCKSMCHVSKDRHIKYRCSEPCNRFLCTDRHQCPKKCFQDCGKCNIPMQRTLTCGHHIVLPCFQEYGNVQCKQLVKIKFAECNHEVQVECYRKDHKTCPEPCLFRLECGHACTHKCHVTNDPDHLNYVCGKPCARRPVGCTTESHKCPRHCSQACEPCQIEVVKPLPCGHKLTTLCTNKNLLCCVPCNKPLDCGHQCPNKCYEKCGNCPVKVEKVVALCGHKVKVACSSTASKQDCRGKCSVTLGCGHKCAKRCKDQCSQEDCVEKSPLPVSLPCGHTGALLPCNMLAKVNLVGSSDKEQWVQYCSKPCEEVLKCGHKCSGTCGQCMQGRIHKVCDEDCGNTLICGHSCPVPCREVCPPCEKKCQNRCVHSKCSKKCGEPCTPCKEPCQYRCEHSWCTKKCGDLCNRKPCTEPCLVTLPCKHPCVGFCGEPCPPCKECSPDDFWEIFYTDEESEEGARYVVLNDCKHVMEARTLEKWLDMDQEGSEIKLKVCPKCRPTEPNRFIATTQRYMNLVKSTFRDIQAVKIKLYGQVEDIRREREELLLKVKSIPSRNMDGFTNDDKQKDELYLLHIRLLRDLPIVKDNRRKEFDIQRLCVLNYMVEYLTTLVNCRSKIWNQLNDDSKLKMTAKVNTLTMVLKNREKKISKAEILSFDLELSRIVRFGDLLVLESCGDFQQLKTKPEVIQCHKKAEYLVNQFARYTEELDKDVFEAIQELRKALKNNAEITAEERRMIHSAMSKSFYGGSSAQGHWFKCPNGHPYTITECGGAMETAKCPEKGCGAMIGGQNHRYLPNQQLFSEMDGAARPAWSSGNDMGNYNFDNIR